MEQFIIGVRFIIKGIYVGIKEGKIYDLCDRLVNKRDNSIEDKDYLHFEKDMDFQIGDPWDYELNDSIKTNRVRIKSEFELLQIEVENLKSKIELLEKK